MFDNLFRPGKIGSLEVKNRVVKAGSLSLMATPEGEITPRLVDYYAELARGGTGLITVDFAYIDSIASQGIHHMLALYSDEHIPGLRRITEVIKTNGARASLQIAHMGGVRAIGEPVLAPSAITYPGLLGEVVPQELSAEQIQDIVEAYGETARRAQEAGFDTVELHGAHGYLINEFLSPHFNKRTDAYGGSLENRMRFALEVLESVRGHVGQGFPITMRISGVEYVEDGTPREEVIEFARALERAGLDAIHVSAGISATTQWMLPPIYYPRGCNVYLAEAVKKAVTIPVMAVGGITTPDLAEEILAAGKADFIALARPLIADPYWPEKAREGRASEIRPCIRCTESCFNSVLNLQPVKCTVNAERGIDYEQTLEPVARPRKVAVVGDGPAGLEAARVAAIKGHEVTLFHRGGRLGGHLIEDSAPNFKAERQRLITYFENELKRLGVRVKREEATAETVEKAGFDAIIAATGSQRKMPKVRGADRPFVIDVVDAYHGKAKGDSVVIVAPEWELGACDLALYLVEQGKKPKILFAKGSIEEVVEAMAVEASFPAVLALLDVMFQRGCDMQFGLRLREIGDGAVVVAKGGKKQTLAADSVVLVPEFAPNDDLARALERRGLEVHRVGDSAEPRRIKDAIHEGHLAARQL